MHATLKDNGSIEISNESKNESKNLDLNSKIFDFIVSNPPYIPTKQISTLIPEIKM